MPKHKKKKAQSTASYYPNRKAFTTAIVESMKAFAKSIKALDGKILWDRAGHEVRIEDIRDSKIGWPIRVFSVHKAKVDKRGLLVRELGETTRFIDGYECYHCDMSGVKEFTATRMEYLINRKSQLVNHLKQQMDEQAQLVTRMDNTKGELRKLEKDIDLACLRKFKKEKLN